jgi:hypothetical protein
MNWWQIALLVGFILAIDLAILGAVFSACASTLKPLRDAFPPVEPAPDAVRKRFQSFGFNLVNLGGCVHVAADDLWLHLRPARVARWVGMRDMSIPWAAITLERVRGKWAVAKVGGVSVRGPAWCLALAGPARARAQFD